MGYATVLIIFGSGIHSSTITSWCWCLLHHKAVLSSPEEHVSINIEGPEESFFNQQQDGDAAAPPAAGGATAEEQQQGQHEEQQREHHPIIQELVAHTHLDNDNAAVAAVAAVPMVDDNNKPAPENCPVANETVVGVDDIFGGWLHSGICECRSTVC